MIFEVDPRLCSECKEHLEFMTKNKGNIYSITLTPDYKPGTKKIENWHINGVDTRKE